MLGGIFMILMMVLIIGAVVLLVRWLGGPWPGHMGMHGAPPGHKALDILKERFARGEIDKAEFEERRRALGE
jgi:putative membrane protein